MSWGEWIQLGGSLLGAFSDYQQGQSAEDRYDDQAAYLKQQAKHNKEISLADAQAAEKDAAAAETAYGWKLRRHLKQVDQVAGRAKAGFAKSGVAIEGSALDTIVDIARSGAEDAALIAAEGKTAGQRGREIAERYRQLAEFGLRDAAFQASMLESAGADAALYGTLKGTAQAVEGIYDLGETEGWWE